MATTTRPTARELSAQTYRDRAPMLYPVPIRLLPRRAPDVPAPKAKPHG